MKERQEDVKEIKAREVRGSKAAAVSPEETNWKTTEEEMVEAFATKTGKREGGKEQDKAPFTVAANTAATKSDLDYISCKNHEPLSHLGR